MIFQGGGVRTPCPPLDPLMIRLLPPSANWTVSILSHTEWWYKKHHLKTNIEMKQTANDKSPGNCWHVARRTHDHRAIALGLPQDDRPMSIRFYGPCKGIVWRPCGLLTTIARCVRSFFGQDDNLKPCVVLTIIVRCAYGDRTMSLRCVYGLRAYHFFKFVIVRS